MATVVEPDNIQPPPHYRPEATDKPQVLTTDTVRQGPAGRRNFWVVTVSTIGAFVACAIAYVIWASTH